MGLLVSKRRIREAAVVNSLAGNETTQAPSVASVSTALAAKLAATIMSPSSGQYVRWNGSAWVNAGIQAGDVPTLNQNTTGTAANVTASSNGTLTTLSALSLPSSQVTGLGTAAALNVPASGDATSGEVVKGSDSRLSDSRTPTTHNHDDRYYTEGEVDAIIAGLPSGGASELTDLSDVTISSPVAGQFLRRGASEWENTGIQASDLPSSIDAAKIGAGTVSNTVFGYLAGLTSAAQTQLDAKATKDVCDTVASDTSLNGTNGNWTTLSDLTVSIPVGKNAIDALVNFRLPTSGVSTQGRFIITAGTINEADGAPVGVFFPHGGTSSAMVYTAATGVISGGVRSSDTTSVVFSAHMALEVTSTVTLSFQYLTGTGTANQLVAQSTTNIRAQLLV